MLNAMEQLNVPARKQLRILSALSALGTPFGIPEVKLLSKARAIHGRLAVVSAVANKRAIEPPFEAIAALETAGVNSSNPIRGYGYLHFRLLAGVSGRYDDAQHTRQDCLIEQGTRIVFMAWQTKTSSSLENPTKVLPLSCPLRSLSGSSGGSHTCRSTRR